MSRQYTKEEIAGQFGLTPDFVDGLWKPAERIKFSAIKEFLQESGLDPDIDLDAYGSFSDFCEACNAGEIELPSNKKTR